MLVFNAVYLRKNKQCSCLPTSFIITNVCTYFHESAPDFNLYGYFLYKYSMVFYVFYG